MLHIVKDVPGCTGPALVAHDAMSPGSRTIEAAGLLAQSIEEPGSTHSSSQGIVRTSPPRTPPPCARAFSKGQRYTLLKAKKRSNMAFRRPESAYARY